MYLALRLRLLREIENKCIDGKLELSMVGGVKWFNLPKGNAVVVPSVEITCLKRCLPCYVKMQVSFDKERSGNGGEDRRERGRSGVGIMVADDPEWQEVMVPPENSVRGREWRIVVETYQSAVGEIAGRTQLNQTRTVMGLEVELKEVSFW